MVKTNDSPPMYICITINNKENGELISLTSTQEGQALREILS